jgi:hypothetical protein
MALDMPRKAQPEPQALVPLTELQRQAAALLADGATDERVAAELGVPLGWVQNLEGSLPMAAEVTRQQWRRYQGHRQRIRSLVEQALDVVEAELEARPTPELAVALLRALKVEPPAVNHQSAEQLLRVDCHRQAEDQLHRKEALYGLGWANLNPGEVEQRALTLFDEQAHRLSAPADPEPAA